MALSLPLLCYHEREMTMPDKRILAATALVTLNLLFFGRLSPANSPSLVLFLSFGLLFMDFLVLWYAVAKAAGLLLARPHQRIRRPVLIAASISTVLLALQSIGQLTIRDIVALMALVGLFWLYLSYYRRKQA
jgi:hypothetical protein